jgi:hypothetical protein
MASSVTIVTGHRLEGWGWSATVTRLAAWPTQPPNQWVLGALSLVVQWPGHEAGHSPPSNAEDKTGGAPPCLHGTVLNKLNTGTTLPYDIYVQFIHVKFLRLK